MVCWQDLVAKADDQQALTRSKLKCVNNTISAKKLILRLHAYEKLE